MSREIKFRAWDNSLKEILPNVQNHINDPDWAFGSMLKNTDRFIVEQFTGLKDKNGVEIYEGDIIQFDGECFCVEFNPEWGFVAYDKKQISYIMIWYNNNELIGNIHQTPELL